MSSGTTTAALVSGRIASANRSLLRTAVLGAAVSAVVAIGTTRPALAGTETWTGASSANWSDPLNWTGDNLPPATADALIFGGASNTTTNNDYSANTQFNGITFAAGAGAFTLGGNSLVLGGDIVNNSAGAQAINLTTVPVTGGNLTYTTGGLVLDGATSNVSSPGGGAISLGQVTFGAQPQSANVSTLNINNSASASGLTVQTNNSSANVINIASGQTFTVGGNVYFGTPVTATGQGTVRTNVNFTGGGNLSVTGGNFYVGLGSQNLGGGDHNNANMDMTGLANFSYTGGGNFGVGWQTRPEGFLKLTPGTNTIVAADLEVGNSGVTGTNSSPNNNGSTPVLYLGTGTNVLNAANITVGNLKGAGRIDWVDAGSGSVTVRGQDGVGRANITVGRSSSGGGTGTSSSILLAGHDADVLADTVTIGNLAGATNVPTGNQIMFDTGTFDVNTLQMALDTNTSASSQNSSTGPGGEFVLGTDATSTGVLNVNTAFNLGNVTTANTTAHTDTATFTVNGGTANINADIRPVNTQSAVTLTSTLNLNGGTLNMMGHDIGSAASPVTTVNLAGGTLANAAVVAANTINVSAPLNATGTPTFLLSPGGTLNATSSPLSLPTGMTLAGGTSASPANVNGDIVAGAGSRITPGSDAATPGTLQFANSLSLDSGSTLHLKLSADPSSGNDLLNVSGNLSLAGTVNFELGALGTGASIGQTYTLINYSGSLTGSQSNIAIIGPGSRKTFTLLPTASTPNQIQITVGGSDPLSLTYTGNGGSTWQVATGPSIWVDGSSNPQQFFNQDTVTFDDTSTNPADIQLVGNLTSGGVTVSADRDYKFAGTGALTGTTGLTKALSGTLTVATNNTNTGTTDIQAGTVRVGDGGTSGSLGTGPINDNATLAFDRSDTFTVPNAISGSGNVEVDGTGLLVLAGNSSYTGTTTLHAGTLKVSAAANVGDTNGGALIVRDGATFDIGGNTAANNFNLGAKTVHIAGNGVGGTAGAITNSGGATQNAAFNNITLDADALVTGSRIDIGRDDTVATRTLDLAGHTLTTSMTGTQPLFSVLNGTSMTAGNVVVAAGGFNIERSAVVDNVGGTITFNPGTVFQAYQIADGSVKRPMTFKGNNTIGSGSGTLAVVNSDMTLDGDVTLQSLASGVPNSANNPLQLSGNISGVGGVTKVGANSVTLAGTQTYAGATAVNGGTLVLSGSSTGSSSLSVADGATVQVPAGGTQTERFGALNLNATGTLDIGDAHVVIGGTTPATLVSYLARGLAGDGSWTGTGLTSASAHADLDPNRLHAIGWAVAGDIGLTGGSWGSATNLAATDIVAKVTFYGDLNLDGRIDADDYARLDRGFAKHLTGWINGDVNYDGQVNVSDYLAIDTTFGQTQGLSPALLAERESQFGPAYVSTLISAVPEPTSLFAACGLALPLLRRRRK